MHLKNEIAKIVKDVQLQLTPYNEAMEKIFELMDMDNEVFEKMCMCNNPIVNTNGNCDNCGDKCWEFQK